MDLPQGWSTCSIDELLEYIQPTEYIVNSTEYSEAFSIPVLTAGKTFVLGKTNEEHGVFTQIPVIIFDDFTTATKYVNFPFKVKSSAMKILKRSSPLVNLKYCFYFMQTIQHKAETHKRYWISEYSKLPISLPPLAEQQRIVEKLEELFSSLDNGIEYFKATLEQLKVYRQAVLKQAFEGKLTNKDVKDGELPEGWKQSQIIDVCHDIKVGIVVQPSKYYTSAGDGVKAFRSANIREFHIEDANWVYFSEAGNKANLRTQVLENDVLLVRSGYPGTSCVVPKKYSGSNAIDIIITRPNISKIMPSYLCAFNNSPFGRGAFEKRIRGSAQQHLNIKEYSRIEIAYPDMKEQQLIISEVESRLSVCDKLEESIAQSLEQAEVLRQSILKKAFEGKLVAQDPNDEPATVLIERIRAEHEAGDAKPPRTRVTKSASLEAVKPVAGARKRGRPRKNASNEARAPRGKK